MKALNWIFIGLLSTSALAESSLDNIHGVETNKKKSTQGFHGQIGLGAVNLPEYVGGEDNETKAIPLINVSYNDTYYFKFNRLGAWFAKFDNGLRVGAVVTKHTGYDKGDGELLSFDRDDSFMAGVNTAYKLGKFSTELGYVTDVSDNSDGSKFYAIANYALLANRTYSVRVSAKVESLSDDVVDYYYENSDSTVNVSLALIGTYQVSRKWMLIGGFSATSLGDEISDSAIVEDDKHNMALLGATYSF